jgi:two-component system, chemotaxis family, sensor kinase Cph1
VQLKLLRVYKIGQLNVQSLLSELELNLEESIYHKSLKYKTCEEEPVHLIGHIQSHGYLLAFNVDSFEVIFWSENFTLPKNHFNFKSPLLLNDFLSEEICLEVKSLLSRGIGEMKSVFFENKKFYIVIRENSANIAILELEEHGDGEEDSLAFFIELAPILTYTTQFKDLNLVAYNTIANSLKQLFGYEKVMIYRFHEDAHGEVIGEATSGVFPSYFGLHFPASDIPENTRNLYKNVPVRMIADVDSKSLKILGINKNHFFDLSNSTLRACSHVHIQYLKNMKVKSSASISIVVDGNLWGLIACHHNKPKHLSPRLRQIAEIVSKLIGSTIGEANALHKVSRKDSVETNVSLILEKLTEKGDLKDVLDGEVSLQSIVENCGIALVQKEAITVRGSVPRVEIIKKIVSCLANATNINNIVSVRSLHLTYNFDLTDLDNIAGVLAICISNEKSEWILWFRTEVVEAVTWAGARDLIEQSKNRLEPRASFDAWKEEVRGYCKAWSVNDCDSVKYLHSLLVAQWLEKTLRYLSHLQVANERIKVIGKEFEDFVNAISHDMKSPLFALRSVMRQSKDFAPSFQFSELSPLLQRGEVLVERLIELLDDLLNFIRLGRKELDIVLINPRELIIKCWDYATTIYSVPNAKLIIPDEMTLIYVDVLRFNQLLENIMINSLRHAAVKNQIILEVSYLCETDQTIIFFTDNGFGISEKFIGRAWKIFEKGDVNIEGSGMGLAIIRRIVENHKGWATILSTKGEGLSLVIGFPIRYK